MNYNHELEIKLVVVGDGAVGKTSMLMSYSNNEFPNEWVPTVFDNYTTDVLVDGRCVRLSLWDTAGQEDYDKLRPLSYAKTDIFIVCFSLVNRTSLNNVQFKWMPELRKHDKSAPIILVGLKSDLRDEIKGQRKAAEALEEALSSEEGLRVARETGACRYLECSAKTQDNLHNVFNEAIRCVISPPGRMSTGALMDCVTCALM